MNTILIAPGAPYFLLAVAGALLAALGLYFARPQMSSAAISGRLAALRPAGRLLIGQSAGVALAAVLALAAVGVGESARTLVLTVALAVYLFAGFVLPRRPEMRRRQQAAELRRLTPGFIAFVRVALGSFEAPIAIMRRYVARPNPRWATMQSLVIEALQISLDQRIRPFAALAVVARSRACRELIDVTEALAQAEAEGGSVEGVLEAQQQTLELVLQGEFRRTLQRRTIYLLLLAAISLVVGILFNLLFVMTGGGSLLLQIGP